VLLILFFFFSSRRRHTRSKRDWSSDVCSSDLKIFNNCSLLNIFPIIICFAMLTLSLSSSESRYCFFRKITFPFISPVNRPRNLRSEERRVGKEGRSEGVRE